MIICFVLDKISLPVRPELKVTLLPRSLLHRCGDYRRVSGHTEFLNIQYSDVGFPLYAVNMFYYH